MATAKTSRTCERCGGAFTPYRENRPQRFCSKACQYRPLRPCAWCGAALKPSATRFCSRRCVHQSWRAAPVHSPDERFWKKVDNTGPIPPHRPDLGRCWIWTGARGRVGHGYFGLNNGSVLAHRWAYEYLIGPIPATLTLDHLCRTPPCVHPLHVEPVTSGVNTMRGTAISVGYAQRTACVHGHPFDDANTKRTATGRVCRACARRNAAAYLQRKAAKAGVKTSSR